MPASPKILVVGASGFIGRAVVDAMADRGVSGVALSRSGPDVPRGKVRRASLSCYDDESTILKAASGCDAAIMLAGRAHVLRAHKGEGLGEFRRINRDLPLSLAASFARAGGRRFVFVSSVAVHGKPTPGRPLSETDALAPVSDYGRSKSEAERALQRRCEELGLQLVIVRPPLVYGPRAPGNFGKLLRAAQLGIPLPLASIHNRRDFIGVENLADVLLASATHPAAAGETFLVSDREETSTAALAQSLYRSCGHENRLFPCSPSLLRLGARMLRREKLAAQLLDDLTLDTSRVAARLGWEPRVSMADGLIRSVQGLPARD
jgi:nucleoside-diphosphate-sugar epimerase